MTACERSSPKADAGLTRPIRLMGRLVWCIGKASEFCWARRRSRRSTIHERPFYRWLIVPAILCAGCGQPPLEAPTAFKEWNAKDGTFCIEYPDDWEPEGGGRNGIQWAKFHKGSALIDVSVSFSESVVGDILSTDGGGVATEEEAFAPVAVIHASKMKAMTDIYSNYREKEAVAIRPPLGDARKSEFQASKGLTPVHGYRVSILNNNRSITVICHCAEKDWKNLQTAFDRIVDALALGTPSV